MVGLCERTKLRWEMYREMHYSSAASWKRDGKNRISGGLVWTNYTSTALVSNLHDLAFVSSSSNANETSCHLLEKTHAHHFPHTLEQVLRCWSVWESASSSSQRILHIHLRQPNRSSFNRGMWTALQEKGNVQISFEPSSKMAEFVPQSRASTAIIHETNNTSKNSWAYPWPESHGFGMLSQEHAKTFQSLFREHSFAAGNVIHEPRITIWNRKSDRRFRKLGRLQRLIKRVLGVKPKLVYFEGMEFFPEQIETMAKTDLLLTPHGAHESLLFALPHCAVLVEAFPYGYALPYYFGSLAALFGVRHGFLYIYGNASQARRSVGERRRCASRLPASKTWIGMWPN